MKQWKRLIYYLLINVVVSACVTLTVLTLWERAHSGALGGLSPFTLLFSRPPTALPTLPIIPATLPIPITATVPVNITPQPGVELSQVSISNVIGAGDLNTERVRLVCTGNGDVSLAGWKLKGQRDDVFTFPQLTLSPGGSVDVYTGVGANDVTSLHWGRAAAVWQIGDIVTLWDAQGKLDSTFTVP